MKLTKAQLRAACAPLAETMSRKEIAEHFGLSFTQVTQAMIGLPRKPQISGVPRSDRDEILPQALAMRPTVSMLKIAQHFQVAPQTVQNWFAAIDDARMGVQKAPKWAKDFIAKDAPPVVEACHVAPHLSLPAWPQGW